MVHTAMLQSMQCCNLQNDVILQFTHTTIQSINSVRPDPQRGGAHQTQVVVQHQTHGEGVDDTFIVTNIVNAQIVIFSM